MFNVIRIDFPADDGAHIWVAASTNDEAVQVVNDSELTRMHQAGELLFVAMTDAEVPVGAEIMGAP